ncbi:hypothetical protein [Neobacillus mesonae]|uniref:Uncharacterized protein n=1 Tax=Neobacillus mesonae TaxID=1193713 RepID=A0A3T0I3Y8_9BACI|nr:hypothetical protein [Neobacillus mesonae]AZU64042.1 hypothetical protein CHR53_23835 [Neobacillus mesonae]
MLVQPSKIDSNEWFILISLLITYAIIFLLPKRFPHSVTLIMLLFSMTYAHVIDHILAGISIDLYDINDVEKYEWFDLIAWFLYPPFGYIFIYFFDRWSVRGTKIFWYILVWAGISLSVEFISLKFDLFTFKEWKLAYSFPVYLMTLSIYLLFFIFIKNSFKQQKMKLIRVE